MITIQDARGSAEPAEIALFQETFHLSLPRDYEQFLLQTNGGVPSEANCSYSAAVELPVGKGFEVGEFFRLFSHDETHDSVAGITEWFIEDLPFDGIAIGRDDSGNLIGIHTDTGCVFWHCCDPNYELYNGFSIELGVEFTEFLHSLRQRALR